MATKRRTSASVDKLKSSAEISQQILLSKVDKLEPSYQTTLNKLEELGFHHEVSTIENYRKLKEIEAASSMSVSLSNWYLGNGLPKSKYSKYFIEDEEELDEFAHDNSGGHDTKLIDKWLDDEVYSLNRLLAADYSVKTIWRLLSYYQEIESKRFRNQIYEDIYIDLSIAIKKLSLREQSYIKMIIFGDDKQRTHKDRQSDQIGKQKAVSKLAQILGNQNEY
jgi:hypothetical protein